MTRRTQLQLALGAIALVCVILGARMRAGPPTAVVSAGTVEHVVRGRGIVQPAGGVVEIRSRIAGRVTEANVNEGDTVEAGAVLAVVTSDAAQAELKTREAELEVARAAVRAATEVPGARRSDVRVAELRAAAVEVAVEQVRTEIRSGRLVSPIRGTVLARRIHVGDVIVAPGAAPALLEVADTSRTILRVEIEETDAGILGVGLNVSALHAQTGEPIGVARIVRVAEVLERRHIGADDARARADGWVRTAWAEWNDRKNTGLVAGQRVDASILVALREVQARVPRGAVRVEGGRTVVRLAGWIAGGEREVVLGLADLRFVEVQGVSPGTVVELAPP